MKCCILFGGPSREHDISLKSGLNVARAALAAGHEPLPAFWTKDGLFRCAPAPVADEAALDEFMERLNFLPELDAGSFLWLCRGQGVEVVFPALHGPWGEDGRVQGFFQVAGIPVVGQDVLGAAISMDKLVTKAMLLAAGLPTARHVELTEADPGAALARVRETVKLPCVLKAPSEGSSFGIAIASGEERFLQEYPSIFAMERRVMAEAFFQGRELTCGVLREADGTLRALPPTEIVPRVSVFFDFEAKYKPGGSDEITPARITPAQTTRIQELAVRTHEALRLGQLSRVDFLLREPDEWVILEANSLPGFTEQSLYPQAAAVVGITFPSLIDMLLRTAIPASPRPDPPRTR
jgi:D-alanine-D-alanine ligase